MTQRMETKGFVIHPGFLDVEAQRAMVEDIRNVVRAAPLFRPKTRFGKEMSVQMTSAGQYGWFSDAKGYRYIRHHPSGVDWPVIPASVLTVWQALTNVERDPECCLVNYYADGAKMGMHQDADEADFSMPVLSISLGDDALFRMGNEARGGQTQSIWLRSGDVVVMGGAARKAYHGIDRIAQGSSTLLAHGGRINLTLRVVT